jgi:serine protease
MSYAVQHGAKIINLSLGSLDIGADSTAFDNAVSDATAAGTLVIVAAGNSGVDAEYMTPANATQSVAVAAHRNDGQVCSFSDYGWKIDVSGPGCGYTGSSEASGILSLNSKRCGSSGGQYCATGNKAVGEAYALKSGTSMSTPHAVGMAAVAWTASPGATPLQIRQALLRTARKPQAGKVNVDFGMGKLSGTSLITEAQTAPGIKIVSPRYGTTATAHAIKFKIESRANPVSWTLRYATNTHDNDIELLSGTVIASSVTDVPALSAVTLTQAWAPPGSGDYLVILEATSNGQKYYDVSLLRR